MWHPRSAARSKTFRRIGSSLAGMMLVGVLGGVARSPIRPAGAQSTGVEALISAIFDDLPPGAADDANDDGALTAADVVALAVPTVPPPTATPAPTPTPAGLLYAGVVSDLLPHAVGDQLIYRVTDPLGAVTTETTTATSSNASGAFVIDDQEVDDHDQLIKHEQQSYTDTQTQLLFNGFTDASTRVVVTTTCTPPLLRMVMPLIAGQMFSTDDVTCNLSLSDGTPLGFVNRTDTFTPVEIVDSLSVAAGTFAHVIHISGTTQVTGAGLESDEIYFAIGVGPILDLATTGGQVTRTELAGGVIGGVPVGQ